MKWILAILLLLSVGAIGQTDDSTKYIHYKLQYGSRMPRFWADSVLRAAGLVKFTGIAATTDTTANKPVVVDASGNVLKMTSWPVPATDSTIFSTNYRRDTAVANLRDEIAASGTAIGSPVTSGTNGSVLFVDGGNLEQDNGQFYWDNTNNRLSLGTNASVNFQLNIKSPITNTGVIGIKNPSGTIISSNGIWSDGAGFLSLYNSSGAVRAQLSANGASGSNFVLSNFGIATTNTQGQLNVGGNKNLTSSGAQTYFAAATYTDNVTAASGTASSFSINLIAAPTIAATNSNVTFPSITNLHVDAPVAGTNATITNKYAIETGTNGHVRVQGKLYLTDRDSSATPANVAWIDPVTEQVKVGPYQRTINGSTTHDFGTIANNSSATTTISVTGAADGDYVLVTKPIANGWSNGESYTAWVSGPDQVTVRQNNNSGGSAGFGSQTINVKVIKQ